MSNSRKELFENGTEKTIRIDEDIDTEPYSLRAFNPIAIKCEKCAGYLENAQKSWQMCASYAGKLREIDSLRSKLQEKEESLFERCQLIEQIESKIERADRELAERLTTIQQMKDEVGQKDLLIQQLSSEVAQMKCELAKKNSEANGVKAANREEYEARIRDLEADLSMMIGTNYRLLAGKYQSNIDEKNSIIKRLTEEVQASRSSAEKPPLAMFEDSMELNGVGHVEILCQEPVVKSTTLPSFSSHPEKSYAIDQIMQLVSVLPPIKPFAKVPNQIRNSSHVKFLEDQKDVAVSENKSAPLLYQKVLIDKENSTEYSPPRKKSREATAVLHSNSPVKLAKVEAHRTLPVFASASQKAILNRVKSAAVKKVPAKKKRLKRPNSPPVKVVDPTKQKAEVGTRFAAAVVVPDKKSEEKRPPLWSQPKKTIMLSELPITESLGNNDKRAAAMGKQTIHGAADLLDSYLITTFKNVSSRFLPTKLKAEMMRKYPDLGTMVSVEKLANLMCKALLELDMGDLWLAFSNRNHEAKPVITSKCGIMAEHEKKFFEFASLLSLEKEWGSLLRSFMSEFTAQLFNSVKEEGTSMSQLSRNFRCFAYARVLLRENANEDQDLLKQHGSRLLSLLEFLLLDRSPNHFVPIFCYLVSIDSDLVISSFFSFDADSIRYRLLRLHFTESILALQEEYSTVAHEILDCYTSCNLAGSSLFTPPDAVEVTAWIDEIVKQSLDLQETISFDGEKFKISKELLGKGRDCGALFSSRFVVELDRCAILSSYLVQILEVIGRATGEYVKTEKSSESVDTPMELYADTLPSRAEGVQAESRVITIDESTAAANLSIVVGRIFNQLLESRGAHALERVISTVQRIENCHDKLENKSERTFPEQLLVFAVEQYLVTR